MSNKKPKGKPRQHPNSEKAMADADAGLRPNGLLTPTEVTSKCVVYRTLKEDISYGRSSTALQLLPNGAVLLLVTDQSEEGADRAHTFIIGEEAHGFTVERAMIETLDGTA